MFVLTANAGARAQQPEPPAAPTENERRDDTAGKSTTELTKFCGLPWSPDGLTQAAALIWRQ
jgi:hypothetical protein